MLQDPVAGTITKVAERGIKLAKARPLSMRTRTGINAARRTGKCWSRRR